MRLNLGAILATAALASVALAATTTEKKAAVSSKSAFESLKSLAGEWEGGAGMSEGGATAPAARVSYRVISGGTVVMETVFAQTPHEMVTMYLVDGDDLVLTHYCAAGNQPKMKLDAVTSTPQDLHFAFAGGTNVTDQGMHMHEARISLVDADHIESQWVAYEGGKAAHTAAFKMSRKK
jgi:hypothetical protein